MAWAGAVNAGLMAIESVMGQVNSTYSCSNNQLLNATLKLELGSPGFVFPDMTALKSISDAVAGVDYSPLFGIDI